MTITAEEFVKLMKTDKELSILDIRSELEYETVALDYPVTHIALDNAKADMHGKTFKDPTYILCKAGPRAQMLNDYLRDIGEDHFIVIDGGLMGCAEYGADITVKRQDVTPAEIQEACQLSIQQYMMS
jgi:rhodanese-related sulfurtransferase